MRRKARILSKSCANSAWWTSPLRAGNPPRRTASCCSTSKDMPRRSNSCATSARKRGAARPVRSRLQLAPRPTNTMPRRISRRRRSTPRSAVSKKRPTNCVRGENSRLRELACSPSRVSCCDISSRRRAITTSSRPSGRSAIPSRRSTAPNRRSISSSWRLPARR